MNPFRKFTQPPYPDAAIGLNADGASVAALARRRGAFSLRSAGYIAFSRGAVQPSFDDSNLRSPAEVADALIELVASTNLNGRRKWSVSLPEATTRSTILTVEGEPAGGNELEEMLGWKIERAFHHPLDELRVARRRLAPDERGRARYLVSGVRRTVLAEYEEVFDRLNWQAGLILPRHMGEVWWLLRDDSGRDSLLVSSHEEGFTAIITRGGEPVVVRNVVCEEEDCTDELFRLLLFYRDRLAAPRDAAQREDTAHEEDNAAGGGEGAAADGIAVVPAERTIERVLLIGNRISEAACRRVVGDTLGAAPRLLRPEDFSLTMPVAELRFDQIAAPAGLAALGG